jgi:hypothetical protein
MCGSGPRLKRQLRVEIRPFPECSATARLRRLRPFATTAGNRVGLQTVPKEVDYLYLRSDMTAIRVVASYWKVIMSVRLSVGALGFQRSRRQLHPGSPGGNTCRHYQACRCSHAAAQLCYPSAGAKDRYPHHPGAARTQKLDTTALYTRVAINALGAVTSPLDLLLKMPG